MSWLWTLHQTQPIAHSLAAIFTVCVFGMVLGGFKVRGIGLGTAGALFAGLSFGHFGKPVDHETLELIKNLGLVLFVFTMGLQLGPGFGAALRQNGFQLNLCTFLIASLGVLGTWMLVKFAGISPIAALGIFAGATTSTPALAASTQLLSTSYQATEEQISLIALAYAVTYPMAIASIIGAILLIKRLFSIDATREASDAASRDVKQTEPLERWTVELTGPEEFGRRLGEILDRHPAPITISRTCSRQDRIVRIASRDAVLNEGDLLVAVGTPGSLNAFTESVGRRTNDDLSDSKSGVIFKRVIVTNRDVLGKTVRELGLESKYDVVVSRITRADIEMTAVPDLKLKFGDMLQIVGKTSNLDDAASMLGNSLKELNETHFVPLFFGIVLGIALGTYPFPVPGMPQPIQLGLAGGPLIVALIVGRIGRIGKMVWHMPASTNIAFREFGISIFFAAVGLSAGAKFFETVFTTAGLHWLLVGMLLTSAPLLIVGILLRLIMKTNFVEISGLLAGSMTDPPALSLATSLCRSDAPMVAYATVYPLTIVLRILSAQILAVLIL